MTTGAMSDQSPSLSALSSESPEPLWRSSATGMFRQRKRCMAASPTAIMMPGITPARNILVMDCCPDTA